MDYAHELLRQGKKIKEVGPILLGHKTPRSFSSAFKRTQGIYSSNVYIYAKKWDNN
jgi:hypothetical protein